MSHTYYVSVPFAGTVALAVDSEEPLDIDALWEMSLDKALELTVSAVNAEDGQYAELRLEWPRHLIQGNICLAEQPSFEVDSEEHYDDDDEEVECTTQTS